MLNLIVAHHPRLGTFVGVAKNVNQRLSDAGWLVVPPQCLYSEAIGPAWQLYYQILARFPQQMVTRHGTYLSAKFIDVKAAAQSLVFAKRDQFEKNAMDKSL
jgi:hypothetical protein